MGVHRTALAGPLLGAEEKDEKPRSKSKCKSDPWTPVERFAASGSVYATHKL